MRQLGPTAQITSRQTRIGGSVVFAVTGAISGVPFNVSSITDTGTGDWTVNWINAFNSADYVVVATSVATAATTGYSTAIKQSTAIAAGSVAIVAGGPTGAAADNGGTHVIAWERN